MRCCGCDFPWLISNIADARTTPRAGSAQCRHDAAGRFF
jgi:hypothetical protein